MGPEQGRELDYATLIGRPRDAEPFRSLIDPRASRFLKPGDMPQKNRRILLGNRPACS